VANGSDDVLIKIATDVGSTTAAMGTLIGLLQQMNETLVQSRDEARATGEAIVDAMAQGRQGTEQSTESAVAWGTQWSQIIDQVQKGLADLVKSFPELVTQTIEAGDAAWAMSKKMGVSVETFDKLQHLASTSGGQIGPLVRTMQELGNTLQDSGSKGAKGIAAIGLSLETLKQSGPDKALFSILQKLNELPEGAARTSAAFDIFGRKFSQNVGLLSENMTEFEESWKHINSSMSTDLAKTSNEISTSWANAGKASESFKQSLVAGLLPGVLTVSKSIEQLPPGMLAFGQAMGSTATAMAPLLGNLGMMVGKKGLEGALELALKGDGLFMALGKSFGSMIPSMSSVAALFGAINLPLVAVIAGVALLGVALYKLMGGWEGIAATIATVIQVFNDLWTILSIGFTKLKAWFQGGSGDAQVFRLAIIALTAPLQVVWFALEKLMQGLSWVFKEAAKWLHGYAVELEKTNKAAEQTGDILLKGPPPAATDQWDALALAMDVAAKAMNEVVLANKDWLLASRDTMKISDQVAQLKAQYEALGLSAEDVTKQLELFYKKLDDAGKKHGEKSPLQKMAEDAKKLADVITTSPITDKMAEFGAEASKAAEKAARIKGGMEALPQVIKDIASAWDAADLAKKWKDVWDATKGTKEATAEFRTQIAGMAEVIGNVGASFLRTITLQKQMATEGMTQAEQRKQALAEEEQAAVDRLAATTHLSDGIRKMELDGIRSAYAEKRQHLEGYYADAEKQAEAWGVKSNAVRAAEIAKEKAKYKRMTADLNTYSAEAVRIQRELVEKMEAEGGEEERMKRLGILTKEAAFNTLVIEQEKLNTLKGYNDAFYNEQIAKQQEVVKAAENAARGIVATTKTTFSGWLGPLADAFAKMSLVGGTAFKGMTKDIGEVVTGSSAMATSFEGVGKAFDTVNKQGHKGFAALGDSFKGAMGGQGALGAVKGLLGGLGSVMPMVGGIIAGVTAAIQVGKKLWDMFTTSGGEKVVKEVGKKFGATITEEMGDAINKNAKEMFKGDRFAAELDKMKDLVQKAGGITEKNMSQQLGNLRQVFDLMNRGTYTQAQATKVLDENFGAFAKHVTESGKVASAAFVDIIKQNALLGTESKEIAKFVAEQTTRLGTAMQKLMGPITAGVKDIAKTQEEAQKLREELAKNTDPEKTEELTKKLADLNATIDGTKAKIGASGEAMARFERLTLAGFNAALAAGMGYLDAVNSIGPALDDLVENNKALGREGGAAIQELLKFREVANANKELVESSGALNEVMLALSNVGALNEETFADMQAQGMETYASLVAAGFTENQALQQMKGYLGGVRDAHKELGLPIDENTQSLLDQAEASGVLRKEQMSTNDIMLQGLGAIIKALGGDLPDAFKTMEGAAKTSADNVGRAIKGDVGGAITDTTNKMNAVPFSTFAAKGVSSALLAEKAMAKVTSEIGQVAGGLAETGFDEWADEAVAAAQRVEDAINGVSVGHSPGGIKEIPIKLREAMAAFKDWEDVGVSSAEAVEDSINAIGESQAAVVSMNGASSGLKDQQAMVQQAQIARDSNFMKAMLAQGGGGDQFSVSVDIDAIDSQGMEQAVESRVIPALVKALRKGGRSLHDVQGVLR
jgi:hypothetical protein